MNTFPLEQRQVATAPGEHGLVAAEADRIDRLPHSWLNALPTPLPPLTNEKAADTSNTLTLLRAS